MGKVGFLLVIAVLSGLNAKLSHAEQSYSSQALSDHYVKSLANAIYKAEGGAKTAHPYGILAKYKTTTPRQACINTIRHKHRDWVSQGSHGEFLTYLASKYAPICVANDPTGLNRNWLSNVRYFLNKEGV